ncbi:MAG: flagellar assembly protein FliX [Rhodospirillaceae bacterium]
MKVEGSKSSSSVQGAGKARKTGQASGGNFASALDSVSGADESAGPEGAEPVSGIMGVGGLLAAQSVDDGTGAAPDYKERQRRAQRGTEMLDRLEDVRRGLLMGAVPKDKLAELARMVREKRERGADPVVSRLLDEIELRAEIELAKLGRKLA